ncbi:MAG TPA: AAA family ATPase [Candidatus Eisenbacteria bacterium]|nr:AAA family ATPase [Candidatus Eisenbacteria bacterium]
MRLERVTVEGFGPLSNFDAALEPKRLNLIIGPNESGKSSFAGAIVATLFGVSTLESEELARPWSGGAHAATIVFAAGTGRYRLRRNFQTQDVCVEQLDGEGDEAKSVLFQAVANPRGKSPELQQYEELLRGWLGFTEARLFRESSFVYESALETRVSPELRHLVSGAVEADYQQIQEALLERLDTLTREHPYDPRQRKRNNRSIETREDRLEQLRARRSRSENVLTELKSRTKEREGLESRITELRGELAGKERLLTDLETWVTLREEQRKLMKRVPAVGQELVLARRARGQAEEIDRRISESLAYLANAPDEVEPDLLRLGMLRSQRSRHLKSAETERTKLEGKKQGSPALAIVLALVGAAAAGGGVYAGLRNPLYAGAAGAVGALAGFAVGRMFGQSAVKTRAVAEAQLKVAEENIRTLSQEIDQIEIRVNPYISGRTLEVVLADVKRFRAANQERREHAAVMQSLPAPERLEAEAKELDEAVAALRAKEKAILRQSPFLAPLKEDPVKAAEAAERLKRETAGLRSKIEISQEGLDGLLRKAGGGEGDAENLETLDEMIGDEETDLARERRQRDALLLALDVLRDSVIAYQQQHVGRLGGVAGSTLARLTAGRYRAVTLDSDFTPMLATDGKERVPLEALSRGARDAFYFALRAALAKELAAREPVPLLLDDPIAHLDEERRGTMLAMLEELAREIQVVLLTHDRRVLNQVREAHVIALGAGVTPASSRKVEARK